jgi:hypothetical protein
LFLLTALSYFISVDPSPSCSDSFSLAKTALGPPKKEGSMNFPINLSGVEGADTLYDWFGYWPDFHDAEVISLYLNRAGESSLVIHTWEVTSEIDRRGYYVSARHVVVEFLFEDILDLKLEGFNQQNVIFGLELQKSEQGYRVKLGQCHGVGGSIEAKELSIRLTPAAHLEAQTASAN